MSRTPVTAICVLLSCVLSPVSAPASPAEYPESLRQELQTLLEARAAESKDPQVLVRLAGVYLDMGDNLFNDTASRIQAYEEGAKFAQRALAIRETDAQAHFLYAANLGSAMQLKGAVASAFRVRDLKAHTARAIELQPDYSAALHMMGMLLEELPRILGGDPTAALRHVQRAVAVQPNFAQARLDLAKMYLTRREPEAAKRELRAILTMDRPSDPYAWAQREKPEAERLLRQLDEGRSAAP
jgi:tetratricopeptide (TPR) repeat protein